MSNLANPSATVDFVYESIDGTKRVPIKAKILTDEESERYDRLYDELGPLDIKSAKAIEIRDKMLAIGIVSPSIAELRKLSRRDVYQLAMRYPDTVDDLELDLLGKSGSRRQFITEQSAADAANPSASTPPASSVMPPPPAIPLS
mgnify:FL=1